MGQRSSTNWPIRRLQPSSNSSVCSLCLPTDPSGLLPAVWSAERHVATSRNSRRAVPTPTAAGRLATGHDTAGHAPTARRLATSADAPATCRRLRRTATTRCLHAAWRSPTGRSLRTRLRRIPGLEARGGRRPSRLEILLLALTRLLPLPTDLSAHAFLKRCELFRQMASFRLEYPSLRSLGSLEFAALSVATTAATVRLSVCPNAFESAI